MNLLWGGRGFHFVHFPIIEKNGIVKAGEIKISTTKGEKSLSSSSLSDIDATIIIVLPLNHLNSRFDKITEHAMWPTFLRYQNTWPHAMIIL